MFRHRTEADEFFAEQRQAVLLPALMATLFATSVASVVFSLFGT